jgi:predicted phage tail protein
MMKKQLYKIRLYGLLKQKFTTDIVELYAKDVREVFEGLQSRFGEEFREIIINGAWHITKGGRTSDKLSVDDDYMSEGEIDLPLTVEELHVFPAVLGAGGNAGRIILGVVLIIVAIVLIWNPAGWAALAGASSALGTTAIGATGAYASIGIAVGLAGISALAGGIAGMLAKSPNIDSYADPDARQSFIFNGAVNNTEQGVPVPLVYGRHLTGSTVISAGIHTEQLLDVTQAHPLTSTADALETAGWWYDQANAIWYGPLGQVYKVVWDPGDPGAGIIV